jgi:hypothetical protein
MTAAWYTFSEQDGRPEGKTMWFTSATGDACFRGNIIAVTVYSTQADLDLARRRPFNCRTGSGCRPDEKDPGLPSTESTEDNPSSSTEDDDSSPDASTGTGGDGIGSKIEQDEVLEELDGDYDSGAVPSSMIVSTMTSAAAIMTVYAVSSFCIDFVMI